MLIHAVAVAVIIVVKPLLKVVRWAAKDRLQRRVDRVGLLGRCMIFAFSAKVLGEPRIGNVLIGIRLGTVLAGDGINYALPSNPVRRIFQELGRPGGAWLAVGVESAQAGVGVAWHPTF